MDDLASLELVVVLGAVLLAAGVLAARFRAPAPVLVLGAGVVLGLLPVLGRVHLPPELLLGLLLPALLWWESLTTSLREIRRNLRGIVLTGSVLVVVTAAAVAVTGHALGLPWGPAWVLGAALAPTDATAVGVLARSLPRRTVTTLRAESLVNDGTALVVYGVAVGVTVGEESLGAAHLSWLFLLSYAGGILAGLVVGGLGHRVRGRLADPLLENVVFLTTPFAAYLAAELIGASGVLAVVVAGLLMSQRGPRTGGAGMRQLANGFWELSTFLVNGTLFVLVGVELISAVRGLTSVSVGRALVAVVVVTAVLVVTRYVFMTTTAHLVRAIDRRPRQRELRVSERARVVSTVAGFRGAVSMAVALSVPEVLTSGDPFPERDLIVFLTAGVITVTLVLQAALLPAVVRWAHLPRDTSVEDEVHLAEVAATRAALRELEETSARPGTDQGLVAHLRGEQQVQLEILEAGAAAGPAGATDDRAAAARRRAEELRALRVALIARKRATVIELRDEGDIDDTVLRQLQARLDDEELRLTRDRRA